MDNYYCNDEWFDSYEAARAYSDSMLKMTGTYYVVYTRAEIDARINHEEECGK